MRIKSILKLAKKKKINNVHSNESVEGQALGQAGPIRKSRAGFTVLPGALPSPSPYLLHPRLHVLYEHRRPRAPAVSSLRTSLLCCRALVALSV